MCVPACSGTRALSCGELGACNPRPHAVSRLGEPSTLTALCLLHGRPQRCPTLLLNVPSPFISNLSLSFSLFYNRSVPSLLLEPPSSLLANDLISQVSERREATRRECSRLPAPAHLHQCHRLLSLSWARAALLIYTTRSLKKKIITEI